jgi:hypothetical protein
VLDESGTSTPNYCLLEKLKQTDGLSVPGLAEPAEDASGIDLEAALRATREAIAAAGLPYRVEPSVDLAILQFAKFRLWKDLDDNWEELSKNSLVNHLIESPTMPFLDPVPVGDAPNLDALAAAVPVPADSSQLLAVADAVKGRTFVLEGPPGTGKSQTITNLIVNAVDSGKRVLFVAEKHTALEVVQTRLAEVGMGHFALDLHDKSSRPAAVRAQIAAALDLRVAADLDGLKASRQVLESAETVLTRYAERLHDENAVGLSFYSARTRLLAIDASASTLVIPPDFVQTVTDDDFDSVVRLLQTLPDVSDILRPSVVHPWRFIDAPLSAEQVAATLAASARLSTLINEGWAASYAAAPAVVAISGALSGAVSTGDLELLGGLASAPRFSIDDIDLHLAPQVQSDARHAVRAMDEFVAAHHPELMVVDPSVIALDVDSINAAAVAADKSSFFGRKKRRLAVRDLLTPALVAGAEINARGLSTLTQNLVALKAQAQAIRAGLNEIPGVALAPEWNPLVDADHASATGTTQWLGWLATRIGGEVAASRSFLESARAYYAQRGPGDDDLSAHLAEAAKAFTALFEASEGDPDRYATGAHTRGMIQLWREIALPNVAAGSPERSLGAWNTMLAHVEPLRTSGLVEARRQLIDGDVHPDDAPIAFQKGVASASVDERAKSTSLGEFESAAHQRSIDRFGESSRYIRKELRNSVPQSILSKRKFSASAPGGRVGLLRRQLERQRGGMGVRALLTNFGDLITDILPCMLMSPESVARFFPAQHDLFDLVVFDEASQVRVADAIGAMGRSRSAVVVGDSKQMPPTSFGEAGTEGDDEESVANSLVKDEESILSECVQAQVPSHWLSWHYRSQDESLISFSNRQYYANRLSSFPTPTRSSPGAAESEYGVSLRQVKGKFLRSGKGKELRTNPVEATAIVDEIKRRFAASPEVVPSLGVITFNVQQRTYIESLLRDSGNERIVAALDDPDGLFIKNLESVQGHERDTVLFSTAFSANERGELPLNFGPLNNTGGERRLNVAVTRARRQVIVFSSFAPQDIRTESTSSVGVKHLRAYLEMAERGGDLRVSDPFHATAIDRHREEIADALRVRGLAVATDVGLSDFRIDLSVATGKKPEDAVLAILLDGPEWASRGTVGDRDGLPVEVLSGLMRWPAVARVWMPEWVRDRDTVLDRLGTIVADAASTKVTPPPAATAPRPVEKVADEAPTERVGAAPQSASAPAALPNELVYDEWRERVLGRVDVLDALPNRNAAAAVASVLSEIVEDEGPVHYARLAKLAAGAFSLSKVADSRAKAILRQLPTQYAGPTDESFAWPTGIDPDTWPAFRATPAGVTRQLEHINWREIVNAMSDLASASAGMYEEELMRQALNLFGGRRMTDNITDILTDAVARGVASGRLRRSENGMIVASE